ncbi:glycosyltransferase [Psychroserpens sp. MEBiC05023]
MMVSVCMITYNHQEYILQSLTSILNQKCNFEFEIILSNDCSTDATNTIIQDFVKQHDLHKKIRYFNQKENLGITPNFIFAIKQCLGKYIAICEGDDFWTDPLKLQKQVDFLEQYSHFSGIATNALVTYDNSKREHLFKAKIKPVLETNDLLEARHFHTATFMFKNESFKEDFPEKILSADRTLFLLVSCFGQIKVLNDVTAVYRKNDGGISRKVTSTQMKLDYKIVNFIKKYNSEFNVDKLKSFISTTVLDYSFKIYFLDFIKASFVLVLYRVRMAKDMKSKFVSIKKSLRIIKNNLDKVILN